MIYYWLWADIQKIIKDLCKKKGLKIVEWHMMSDHIHLLLSTPSKYGVSQIMGYLKGKIYFWAERYCVSTVGLNIAWEIAYAPMFL